VTVSYHFTAVCVSAAVTAALSIWGAVPGTAVVLGTLVVVIPGTLVVVVPGTLVVVVLTGLVVVVVEAARAGVAAASRHPQATALTMILAVRIICSFR
jgi:hypothetical protein